MALRVRRFMVIVPIAGIAVVIVLLAQIGVALAAAPHRAPIAGQHAAQAELTDAGWTHHPQAPCEEDCCSHGEACCLTGGCHTVVGWAIAVQPGAPLLGSCMARYTAAVAARCDGHATGPTPPPPRRSV